MYVLAKNNSIVALDAATGREIWIHANNSRAVTARGLNYWQTKTVPIAACFIAWTIIWSRWMLVPAS